ncbi:sulfatase-like hydrolase/transferase [Nocardia goodfellowii]
MVGTSCSSETDGEPSRRVVFFHIDGLHVDAPQRLGLTNVQRLAARGTSVPRLQLPIPWHPTTNGFAELSTTSFPNPVTYAGTVFLEPSAREEYLQEQFPGYQAHIANSTAYRSLNEGYEYTRLRREDTDTDVVHDAMAQLSAHPDLDMIRIVLQDTGSASQRVADARGGEPWARDIWAPGSPYIDALRSADRLLGEFLDWLERGNRLDDTIVVLLSDGQASTGWHPVQSEESALAPVIFAGPGIAAGRVLPYAEATDIAPTVAALIGVPAPNVGEVETGIVLPVRPGDPVDDRRPRKLAHLNEQIREHLRLRSWVLLNGAANPLLDTAYMRTENGLLDPPGAQFYGIERIAEWSRAGSLDRIIADNATVLDYLHRALGDAGIGPAPEYPRAR